MPKLKAPTAAGVVEPNSGFEVPDAAGVAGVCEEDGPIAPKSGLFSVLEASFCWPNMLPPVEPAPPKRPPDAGLLSPLCVLDGCPNSPPVLFSLPPEFAVCPKEKPVPVVPLPLPPPNNELPVALVFVLGVPKRPPDD